MTVPPSIVDHIIWTFTGQSINHTGRVSYTVLELTILHFFQIKNY